jgi:hypothetical protein
MTDKTDSGSPLLTKSQRRLLWERHTGEREEDDRREKSRIRGRVRDILSDFAFLYRYLPADEQRTIFDDLNEFAEWRAEESSRAVALANEREEADGPRMRAAAEQSDAAERGEGLYKGLVGALALMYRGVGNDAFEGILEQAVKQVGRNEGLAWDVEVTIDHRREIDREELLERWEEGDATKEELLEAFALDSSIIFEAVLGGDSDEDEDNE